MNRLTVCVALAATLGMGMGASLAHADGFTYHGSLQDAGKAANGRYDLQLTLYSAQTGGSVLAGPVTLYGVEVKDGNFSTSVDFGPVTLASQGWVGVAVKAADGSDFVALDARSPVAPDGGCPGSWALDGNAGNPSGSYLGTSDANEVRIKTNGTTAAVFGANQAVQLAFSNLAAGQYSTAIGYNASTSHAGSIVTGGYSDSFGTAIHDSATNQFIVAAAHGVGINTSVSGDGMPLRDELTIKASPDLPADNADLTLLAGTFNYRGFDIGVEPNGYFDIDGLYLDGTTLVYDRLLHVNHVHSSAGSYGQWAFNGATNGYPLRVGTTTASGNGAYLSATGIWTNASSRTWKDTFTAIDPVSVLEKLVAVPVQTWYYKGNHDDGRHIGPVAEDFARTFGFGNDEKYIGTVDESGVALAAIQGLNRKVERENETLRRENTDLRTSLERIVARLDRLEGRKGD